MAQIKQTPKTTRTPALSQARALANLDAISAMMHSRFDDNPGSQARLTQLDNHMATVRMVLEHTFEEAERSKG
jgi:hypothetical protein